MASFDFDGAQVYDSSGATVGGQLGAGNVTDQGGGATPAFITSPTTSTATVLGQNITYVGTAGAGANTLPVFSIDGTTNIVAFAAPGDTLPPTLPTAALNPGDSFVVCFAAGTEIATADGFALVEELSIGDMIRTFDGRDVAVKWVGRQTVSTRFGPAERLQPVKIAAGALGENVPSKDLIVTADHALLIGDTLCHAGALVNGTTITRTEDLGERFTVYHVETEGHEVIVANGAAAETYIDNVSRTAFDNFAEFEAMYGDVAEMEELGYPRAMTSRQVPAAIKAALDAEKVA